jgi:ATP-dependent Clp protease, protease subunit
MKNPMRVIEGTAKPFEPFWLLRNAAESESGEPEIDFYGTISEFSWWGDEITPEMFRKDLNDLGGGGPITIRIHSAGGDVFAASAIRSMIIDYPGKVTTRIDGLCASAATYVAMAGDRVLMQDSAFFMIHDPWTIALGGVEDMKAAIDLLKTVKAGIIETYQSKTSLEPEKISKMMADETWMTARQAQEFGFVDEVVSSSSKMLAGARNLAVLNCLKNYAHVPDELMDDENVTGEADASAEAEPEAEEPNPPAPFPEREGGEEEAQKLRDYLAIFGPR